MDRLVIQGGHKLNGHIPISGAKNSALKLMVACLLTDQPITLTNMPSLADTRFLAQLLETLGVEVYWPKGESTCHLNAAELKSTIAPYDQVRKMRASFNVLGPLIARSGHATVSLPGGCAIGARPVDLHLQALAAMGADLKVEQGYVKAAAIHGLKGAHINFSMPSVGATEHAMLTATLAEGTTILENAAREPEIEDLANCLNSMGADITGAGTAVVRIKGAESLKGTTHSVMADRIEAGTYAIAAAAAGGDVTLDGCPVDALGALIAKLREAGVTVDADEAAHTLRIRRNGTHLKAVNLSTQPHPGFPTDLQAQFMALMAIADGTSVIRETIFENRFMHAPELSRLGADITVRGQEAIVKGVPQLTAAPVMATDLRASVSLVIAGLAAEGETVVNRIYHLDRGFERLEEKLTACGAKIERRSGEEE
ncbi:MULTISPECIES: UDP-N-acetylglucosamine 1-carboxyvinyltransferase [unclassified Hyphomonas]|jgi:UDP-N-acetylglucosamine 1-carboxyvinyltransferase|uniref:UDP-N-acetylglucosamine 1-carboxyvinyltransferase n=1 Tax=unclassified Hyphomonas TaxID=2630699 RepID=UPI0004589CBE|nr:MULTISPECIES: UDP-N-acetylglucosamine 1-carboxyvinyltransferase [unclassified Hyphomonas]KCZ45883.1 UDP-N-acetylglucosamine 1-carboxyvinyltransferase [Hyphomonas sp. CY54-11-8]RAN41294.1 UDP-N-acetylglucosamine 1-carboxyvinyltransferase [Hyphomonas sp. GM-8P]